MDLVVGDWAYSRGSVVQFNGWEVEGWLVALQMTLCLFLPSCADTLVSSHDSFLNRVDSAGTVIAVIHSRLCDKVDGALNTEHSA